MLLSKIKKKFVVVHVHGVELAPSFHSGHQTVWQLFLLLSSQWLWLYKLLGECVNIIWYFKRWAVSPVRIPMRMCAEARSAGIRSPGWLPTTVWVPEPKSGPLQSRKAL